MVINRPPIELQFSEEDAYSIQMPGTSLGTIGEVISIGDGVDGQTL